MAHVKLRPRLLIASLLIAAVVSVGLGWVIARGGTDASGGSTVIVDETRTFGSDIKLKKLSPPQPGSPKLTLTGTLVFGEVIVYGSKHITLSDRIQGNF